MVAAERGLLPDHLRALAHLSQDKALKTAFLNDDDIQTETQERSSSAAGARERRMRRAAKVVNFGASTE